MNSSDAFTFRRSLSSPLAMAVLVIAAALLATSAARMVLRERTLAAERQALEERISALEAERRSLEERLRTAATSESVERLAKEHLNQKNPGEEVAIVEPLEVTPPPPSEPELSWFARMFGSAGWIGHLFNFFAR
ncbi:hypothetical protein C4552_00040 [Candidatus Parcubacteria bacterium]|nr:MAG: hypothetical protein C4552_00040 [Candidatus Parcubacteria bacterium]